MDINRTGARNRHIEDPATKAERTSSGYRSSASQPVDPGAGASPAGVPEGVSQADLRDPQKAEETLSRCFGDLLDQAGSQLGMTVSDAQKGNLLEFLQNDPVMRGKLLSYLEQVVK